MENVSEILSRSVSFKCWWIAIRQHVIKCLTLIKIFICPAWIKKHLLKIHSILAVLLTKAKALSTGTKPALIGPPSLKMSRTSSGSRKDSLYQLSNSATNTKGSVSVWGSIRCCMKSKHTRDNLKYLTPKWFDRCPFTTFICTATVARQEGYQRTGACGTGPQDVCSIAPRLWCWAVPHGSACTDPWPLGVL